MEKLALWKNKLRAFHQPYMHIVIAIVHHFLYGVNFPVHSMYSPISGCNVSCCRFLTTSKWYVRVTISTLNFAVGVDGNPQPCCFRYMDWGNSIYVTLYMWFTSVINPRVLCVCQHTDPGMTLKHRDLIHSGRVATRWYQSTCWL